MRTLRSSFLVVIAVSCVSSVLTLELEYKAKYYTNTTLICDDKALELPYTVFKICWVTPNGRFFNWDYPGDSKYTVGEAPYFNLTINTINDDDFGWYYCVILWDNYIYLTYSIKVGLNVHGADYSDLYTLYQNSFFIGGIAAAGTAVVITLCCLVYWCRYSETNTVNKPKKLPKSGNSKGRGLCRSSPSSCSSSLSSSPMSSRTGSSEVNAAIYVLDKAVKDFDEPYSLPRTQSEITTNAAVGFNLRRLSSFKGEDSFLDNNSDYNLPPPPPNMLSSSPPSPSRTIILSPTPAMMSPRKPLISSSSSSPPLSPQIMLPSPTVTLAPSSPLEMTSSPTSLTSPITEHRKMTETLETYDMVMGDLRNSIMQKANEELEDLTDIYAQPDDQQTYAKPVKRSDDKKANEDSTKIGAIDIVDSSEFHDQIADEVF